LVYLQASLDEPTRTVMMHRTEPTRLQSLALQLSEKVSSLMDNNEKMAEMKQGGFYQRQGLLFWIGLGS
jgi:translation initiation factor 3 subunit C